jgi:phosphatidate cytidylyltransferase
VLRQRLITAFTLLPLFLAAVFLLPDWGWALLLAGITLLAAWEWGALAQLDSLQRSLYVVLTAALLGALYWCDRYAKIGMAFINATLVVSAAFWLVLAPIWLLRQPHLNSRVLVALIGWVVLVPTWVAALALRALGPWWLLGALAVIWLADTAAYFSGRAFGRNKLAPTISPGKTWEGVLGAFAATTVYAVCLFAWAPGLHAEGLWRLAVFVVVVWVLTGMSVTADLFESWMKRRVNLKDSGQLLPGHGGILDRIDALTSTLPLAALLKLNSFWL